jgi:threonine-phosphate decarboxylase
MKRIKAEFGISRLGPSRKVKAAVRKATGNIGANAEDALSRFHGMLLSRSGVGHDNVLTANSLKELVYLIPRVFKPKKTIIIGPAPGSYKDAALAAGAVSETITGPEETGFLPAISIVQEKVRGCDMIFIANPNRITGKTLATAALQEVISACAQDSLVVIDESLLEFTNEDGCVSIAPGCGNVLVLRTTACYYGLPGLELAYAVSSPEVIGALRKDSHWDINLLSIEAARAALKDKAYRRESSAFVAREKGFIKKEAGRIAGLKLYDSDANILLMKADERAAAVAGASKPTGLAVELCDDVEGLGAAFFRVSIMRHEHNLKFIKLLRKIFTLV